MEVGKPRPFPDYEAAFDSLYGCHKDTYNASLADLLAEIRGDEPVEVARDSVSLSLADEAVQRIVTRAANAGRDAAIAEAECYLSRHRNGAGQVSARELIDHLKASQPKETCTP